MSLKAAIESGATRHEAKRRKTMCRPDICDYLCAFCAEDWYIWPAESVAKKPRLCPNCRELARYLRDNPDLLGHLEP